MNDLTQQAQTDREQKIGKRQILLQQRENLRIHIDAIIQAIKQDQFGVRDVELQYVEKIDYKKAKFLLGEASKKAGELRIINKEIDALNAALGDTGNE